MTWTRTTNTLVRRRAGSGSYQLLVPWLTVERLFSACGMAETWKRCNYKVGAFFYVSPRSDYVYLVLSPRSSAMPKDSVAGVWRSAVVKADGRAVLDKRNLLEFRVDGLHSLRQFEPGDRLETYYKPGANVIRVRMPRRSYQTWDWADEEDLWP